MLIDTRGSQLRHHRAGDREHEPIHADRQEVQVYLRDTAPEVEGYEKGWNVRYTTELTEKIMRMSAWSGEKAIFSR